MRQRALSRGFAALATAAFVWALILSVSPDLHGQIHPDQNSDHSCVVTFVQSGSCHYAAPNVGIISSSVSEFATIPDLSPQWVPSPFLIASVFEHGPPVFS